MKFKFPTAYTNLFYPLASRSLAGAQMHRTSGRNWAQFECLLLAVSSPLNQRFSRQLNVCFAPESGH